MTDKTSTYDDAWESCLDLSRTFPTIYGEPGPLLSVSFGWHKLLYKYGPLLEAAAVKLIASRTPEENTDHGPPRIYSAKQKYGRLDISVLCGSDEIYDLLSEIEDESRHTCEICGNDMAKQESEYGWITTLCDKHKNQK